jgi:hypothetical protein
VVLGLLLLLLLLLVLLLLGGLGLGRGLLAEGVLEEGGAGVEGELGLCGAEVRRDPTLGV